MTIGYAICLAASIALLLAYMLVVKNKEFWLTMLHICVSVVNLGYLLMAMTGTVEFAVLWNDLAYLGSVFLSMCMLLTIVRLCGFVIRRWHLFTCLSLGILMFAIIASSPMIPLYYVDVSIETVGGATKLIKEYGVLHNAYLVYLLGYLVAMIATIVLSVRRGKLGNPKLAGFIAAIVCSNIVVWLFEKLVSWEYEFLSVTYLISELLLLCVYWLLQDYILKREVAILAPTDEEHLGIDIATIPMDQKIGKVLLFVRSGEALAPREREILELILDNKKRREIAEEIHLSENTVKTHTRSLYSKLGVGSRTELYALLLKKNQQM